MTTRLTTNLQILSAKIRGKVIIKCKTTITSPKNISNQHNHNTEVSSYLQIHFKKNPLRMLTACIFPHTVFLSSSSSPV